MRIHTVIIPFVEAVLLVVETLLGLRLLLRFLGARQDVAFVQWLYATSEPLIEPFVGIFPSPVIEGRFVLEFSTLFAMLIYALIAYVVIELVHYIARASE
jgi:uncharacterized protein YggT (Ycf19 family)